MELEGRPFALAVMTTYLRNAQDGERAIHDVADAARCLGRPYRLIGHVVAGRRRGRTVGFPTCNLEVHGQAIPAIGVYGGRAHVGGAAHPCVINIGVRPTFEIEAGQPVVEAHLLDAEIDAYGLKLELDVEMRIREEKKFAGAADLHAQIQRDIGTFRRALDAGMNGGYTEK